MIKKDGPASRSGDHDLYCFLSWAIVWALTEEKTRPNDHMLKLEIAIGIADILGIAE